MNMKINKVSERIASCKRQKLESSRRDFAGEALTQVSHHPRIGFNSNYLEAFCKVECRVVSLACAKIKDQAVQGYAVPAHCFCSHNEFRQWSLLGAKPDRTIFTEHFQTKVFVT